MSHYNENSLNFAIFFFLPLEKRTFWNFFVWHGIFFLSLDPLTGKQCNNTDDNNTNIKDTLNDPIWWSNTLIYTRSLRMLLYLS